MGDLMRFFEEVLFQSTHPVRGGTLDYYFPTLANLGISIHPPREGWDYRGYVLLPGVQNFNPPTP